MKVLRTKFETITSSCGTAGNYQQEVTARSMKTGKNAQRKRMHLGRRFKFPEKHKRGTQGKKERRGKKRRTLIRGPVGLNNQTGVLTKGKISSSRRQKHGVQGERGQSYVHWMPFSRRVWGSKGKGRADDPNVLSPHQQRRKERNTRTAGSKEKDVNCPRQGSLLRPN